MSENLVRFTDSARDALRLAKSEAQRLGYGYVGCEHLLLGLLREGMGMAGIILRTLGLNLATVQELVPPVTQDQSRVAVKASRLDLSPSCKRAINRAIEEARILDHPMVSTEHLLIAIISQAEGSATHLLLRLGVTAQLVDAHIQQVLDDGGSGAPARSADRMDKRAFEDRYRIETVIGVGSMSTVYRARDLNFPGVVKLVAIKEMLIEAEDASIRSQMIRSFQHEASILASLKHPFIPRFYDFFSIDQRIYIVMEYVVGQNLEVILEDTAGLLPVQQVIDWAIQLCDVLTYLHTHPTGPVIFRDLKPSNIMIDRHGNVRLIDFNIARTIEMGKRSTGLGTQGYAPPEQYHGVISPLVDIYALGATLHHLLTGRDPRMEPPFSFERRPIREINLNISSDLDALIYKALSYNPDQRYPGAEAMKAALMAIRARRSQHGTGSRV